MTDRTELATMFLSRTEWAGARRAALAGDASNRRYERLTDPTSDATAVLMDAPPERGENIRPFVRIARFLSGSGLSAPTILAEDAENGYLLLEDLGDDLFAKIIPRHPEIETVLYETATDVLVALHTQTPPRLDTYDSDRMTDLASLAFDKYYQGIAGPPNSETLGVFKGRFKAILDDFTTRAPPVLIQRDYHAENLLWLPDRTGIKRVGLLDFQDAMLGHPAYDLVSLLQDARRDVPEPLETAMIARYVNATGQNIDDFMASYAVLGAQRNMRILGVFARLGLEYGKPGYVDLIPRVWDLLLRNLAKAPLEPVATLLRDTLPEPTPDNLKRLKHS